jgi:hypothetical protein
MESRNWRRRNQGTFVRSVTAALDCIAVGRPFMAADGEERPGMESMEGSSLEADLVVLQSYLPSLALLPSLDDGPCGTICLKRRSPFITPIETQAERQAVKSNYEM